MTLNATLTQSPGVELTAVGSVPTVGPALHAGGRARGERSQIDLRVQSSRINLGIVQSFTTAVTKVAGTVQADVRVTGTAQDPQHGGLRRPGGRRVRGARRRHLLHRPDHAIELAARSDGSRSSAFSTSTATR